ncbi:MAG TPA: glycosyl transferase family 90, partial [Casimicrobium sp.]|nr:glycosyl transferase family 90 [Casimicrobium sp.]
FQPWEHFVPVANDCADLAEKLQWCRDNDSECEAIAQRARAQATRVYDPVVVADELLQDLRGRAAGG